MAAFLNDQLDFIFFFYGLAFILLGATCVIATGRGGGASWALLGGFGFVHGVCEWLDLTALIVGDSPSFAVLRLSVMTFSFLLLLDFARLEGIQLGLKLPGRWLYVIMALGVGLACILEGPLSAGIVARYAIGFIAAAGAGGVLVLRARLYTGGARNFAIAAAAGFIIYAVATGLVVPAGRFWPSTIVNYGTFTALTGMPVQLVRGVLACWISFSVWGIWSQRIALEIGSPRYSAFVREQFIWTLVVMGAILVSGWVLTEHLGGIYRENVQREAHSDIDMLTSRLAGDTATIEAMAQSLAGSPSIAPLLARGSPQDRELARQVLDMDIEAAGAEHGYILGRTGAVLVSANRREGLPGAAHFGAAPFFRSAIAGRPTGHFSYHPEDRSCEYSQSYPIQDASGRIVGVAMLAKSLASLEQELHDFDRPYFLVDPDGVVQMTNRPDAQFRALWPSLDGRRSAAAGPPMLDRRITGESWVTVAGERTYVRAALVDRSGWSLVIVKPPRQIFATRFLGIVITLLVTIMALIYLLGRARLVHDEVQRDNRQQLQNLAQDLGVKATTDALTGLHNRLKLESVLVEEMQRSDHSGAPLSVIMFDIDHFKAINDTYGHTVGDQVLVQLSRLVSSYIRNSDMLVRWGGEEFLILMPGASETKSYQLAEKCRDAIEKISFDGAGQVTCSFGVAQYASGESAAELVTRVDAALYRAKQGGRNQVKQAVAA